MSTEPGEAKPPGDGVQPSVSRGRACTYMVTTAIRLRGLGPVIYHRGTLVRRIGGFEPAKALIRGLNRYPDRLHFSERLAKTLLLSLN
jgi:hypothetical protein